MFCGQAIATGSISQPLMAHIGSRDRLALCNTRYGSETQEMIIRRSIYAREERHDGVRGQSSSISHGIKDWHAESEKPPHQLTPHRTHALPHLNIWQTMKVQPLKCPRSASGMKWGDKRIPLGNQQGYELAVSFRWGGREGEGGGLKDRANV